MLRYPLSLKASDLKCQTLSGRLSGGLAKAEYGQSLSVAPSREQRPPHDCIKDTSCRCKVTRCLAQSLSKWLSEAIPDQVYMWY